MTKVGDRVGAIRNVDAANVYFYGYGIYDGMMSCPYRPFGMTVAEYEEIVWGTFSADFGITEKTIPESWLPEAPDDYVKEKAEKTNSCPDDVAFCLKHAASVEEYHRKFWKKYDRRNYWIKWNLDPVVKEIVDMVPVKNQPGTMRWAKVYGVV